MKTLFSLVESPFPPHFPDLYQELGIVAERFDSARNLHRALQKQAPDFFVGEFVYGGGNDYAGNTVSNLDVTLPTLQSKAAQGEGDRGDDTSSVAGWTTLTVAEAECDTKSA